MSSEMAGTGESEAEVRNFAIWTMRLTFGAMVSLAAGAWIFLFVMEYLSQNPAYGPLLTWLPVVIVAALIVYSFKYFRVPE